MKRSNSDNSQENAFQQALACGDVAAVSKFLDEGFSANYQSENMPSPMATAINKDNVALVQLLLQRGYEINQPLAQLSLRTALMRALEEMSHRGATSASPVFESLLTAGADVNARDKYGATLAHLVAAGKSDKSELLARLCTVGLQLNVTDNFGETPFTQANRYANLKCAEFLLQKGADVNQRGRDKMTSLIIAAQKGLLQVCQWLVSKGADLHAKDDFNKTALDWGRANGHTKVVEFLEQKTASKS